MKPRVPGGARPRRRPALPAGRRSRPGARGVQPAGLSASCEKASHSLSVRYRHDHPFLERPALAARVEEVRSLEGERPGMRVGVGQLEHHRAAREAGDHLPAPLHAGHAHHLRRRDVVVLSAEVVDELLVALLRVHASSLRPDFEEPAILERKEACESIRGRPRCITHFDPDLFPVDEERAGFGRHDQRFLDRSATVRRRILGVEAGRHAAKVVGEAAARSMEVEITQLLGRARVPEGVDDEHRRDHERSSRDGGLLPVGAETDRQLTVEHVEEVGVMSVDVGIGAVPSRPEPRPRSAEHVAVAEDLDPPVLGVADDLAFAGD